MPTVRKFVGMPVLGEGVVSAECVGNHLEFPMGRNICVFFFQYALEETRESQQGPHNM